MKREVAAEMRGIFVEYVRKSGEKTSAENRITVSFSSGGSVFFSGRRIPRFRQGANDTPGTV